MSGAGMQAEPARVLKATLSALAVAVVILVLVVWPVWFGIGPTVREPAAQPQVANEAQSEAAAPESSAAEDELAAIMAGNIRPAAAGTQKSDPEPFRTDVVDIPLEPGQEVEFKAHMQTGDTIVYSWQAPQPVYVDLHGEPYTYPDEPAVRYEEADGVPSGNGRVTAAFPGMHGWFWLNTSEEALVIQLKVSGFYSKLEEVYRSEP